MSGFFSGGYILVIADMLGLPTGCAQQALIDESYKKTITIKKVEKLDANTCPHCGNKSGETPQEDEGK